MRVPHLQSAHAQARLHSAPLRASPPHAGWVSAQGIPLEAQAGGGKGGGTNVKEHFAGEGSSDDCQL